VIRDRKFIDDDLLALQLIFDANEPETVSNSHRPPQDLGDGLQWLNSFFSLVEVEHSTSPQ
jgi:hypothetical protein